MHVFLSIPHLFPIAAFAESNVSLSTGVMMMDDKFMRIEQGATDAIMDFNKTSNRFARQIPLVYLE